MLVSWKRNICFILFLCLAFWRKNFHSSRFRVSLDIDTGRFSQLKDILSLRSKMWIFVFIAY